MPMTWNQETDARLLIAIINTTPNINWEAAAAFLDPKCTISALKHRVARLKDRAGMPVTPRSKTKTSKTGTKRAASMKASKEDLEKAKSNLETKTNTYKKVKVEDAGDEDSLDRVNDHSDEEEEFPDDDSFPQYV